MINVDGGARGNPGPAGAGVVIRRASGERVFEAAYFLGHQTNNAAEYYAVIRALTRAADCGEHPVCVYSDSELLVRQITGEYAVKSANLAPLHQQVQLLLLKMPGWSVRHIKREENRRADELANLAMDRKCDVIVFDCAGSARVEASAGVPASAGPRAETAVPGPGCGTGPAVRVTVAEPPGGESCPAGPPAAESFTVATVLPAGLCIHAAQALLPTILAMLNTKPNEFAAIPTLTVRCSRPGCGAVFQLAPIRPGSEN